MPDKAKGDLFSEADRQQIEGRGILVKEAVRQIRLLRQRPKHIELDRPCTGGDGVDSVPADRIDEALRLHDEAAGAGKVLHFVPASGAASRMFKELLFYQKRSGDISRASLEADREAGNPSAQGVLDFVDSILRFAFVDELARTLSDRECSLDELLGLGQVRPILDALLSAEGLDLDEQPKGLIEFHRYGDDVRTPFDEHLVESAQVSKGADRRCRLHFTVSPAHLDLFRRHLEQVRSRYEENLDACFEVDFSVQHPATDTLAVDGSGEPVRALDGRLLFRPGGHGALIKNLEGLDAAVVLVKNVDNVAVDRLKGPTYHWTRLLGGTLLRIQERLHDLLRRLDEGEEGAVEEGRVFAEAELNLQLSGAVDREEVRSILYRPVRVCGMVPNTGEPGGGPFWVRSRSAEKTVQIVERSEIDPASESAQAIFESGTHFNPVFLALGLRDHRGRPYELRRFIDQRTYFLSKKAAGGRDLLAFEHPGLWNGGMARWHTLFIDVPIELFNPVKTVADLLRREHQAG